MSDRWALAVVDIRGFNRELRRVGPGFPRQLRIANKASAEVIVPEMQRRVPKGKTRKLYASIGARATTRSAYVKAGTEVRVPYAGPINFGWPAHNIEPQEFIYSSIKAKNEEIFATYEQAVDDLVRRAFPEGSPEFV